MDSVFEKPKIFISHGRARLYTLSKLQSFLQILNVESIIVVEEPNQSLGAAEKVFKYLDEADCVLVLATPDNASRDGECQPRANVSHETRYYTGKDSCLFRMSVL